MREIVHMQAGQCGNQIGAKVSSVLFLLFLTFFFVRSRLHSRQRMTVVDN